MISIYEKDDGSESEEILVLGKDTKRILVFLLRHFLGTTFLAVSFAIMFIAVVVR